jgi:macrolide transport system ATP-binding/permease protein
MAVAAGLFVRTLNNLHSVQLGYARENILLFSLNARQAGHRDPEIAIFYADLRKRFESIPGVSSATLSQSSIINAGRAGQAINGPMKIGAVTLDGARVMSAGPRFLTTMQIPILAGREIDDRDQPGSRPVAVISERLARTYFGNENPVGRRITLPDEKRDLEVSSPGESHPEALSEPYLNLSAHTAPTMEPRRTPICQCAHNFGSRLEIRATQCVALRK